MQSSSPQMHLLSKKNRHQADNIRQPFFSFVSTKCDVIAMSTTLLDYLEAESPFVRLPLVPSPTLDDYPSIYRPFFQIPD